MNMIRSRILSLAAFVWASSALPSSAISITDLGTDPTSSTFTSPPGLLAGPFDNFYKFQLTGFSSISAYAANTATGSTPAKLAAKQITGLQVAVYSNPDGIIGNGDDLLVLGWASGVFAGSTQTAALDGTSLAFSAGAYYFEVKGTGGGSAAYTGEVDTSPVPGPVVGAGLQGLVVAACFGLFALARRRRRWALDA